MKDETVLLEIGNRIKEFRKTKNLKQEEFAKIAKITRQVLSNIECGSNGISEMILRNLIFYFPDFDANYILTGKKKDLETTPTEGG